MLKKCSKAQRTEGATNTTFFCLKTTLCLYPIQQADLDYSGNERHVIDLHFLAQLHDSNSLIIHNCFSYTVTHINLWPTFYRKH